MSIPKTISCALFILLAAIPAAANAQLAISAPSSTQTALTTYHAGSKVAIVVVNNSGEKSQDVRSSETNSTVSEISGEFVSHQLIVLDDATVRKGIGSTDMTDEENYTKSNLYTIGKAAGADLVVLAVIQDTGQSSTTTLFDDMRGGWVSTKFWLVDVNAKRPIVDAKVYKGDSRHHAFGFGLTSGKKMQTNAAANAVRDAFSDFFKTQAPPTVKS